MELGTNFMIFQAARLGSEHMKEKLGAEKYSANVCRIGTLKHSNFWALVTEPSLPTVIGK